MQSEEDKLELISDYELAILMRHHRFVPPFAGFFFGTTEELEGLYYLPDQCRVCQEEEVSVGVGREAKENRYQQFISSVPLQRVVISTLHRVMTLHEERKIPFTPKEKHCSGKRGV